MYVVMYKRVQTIQFMDKDPFYGPVANGFMTKTVEMDITDYREFDNEVEAVEFATKKNGVILVPAKVNMSIEQPRQEF